MEAWGAISLLVALGLALGSFGATTAWRLKNEVDLLPPSTCEGCGHRISPVGLFPVLGFLLLQGRCPHCGYQIPKVYPLLEATNGLLGLSLGLWLGPGPEAVQLLVLFDGLALLSWLDFSTGQVYTLPVVTLVLLQALWYGFFDSGSLADGLIGLLAGAGLFHWTATLFLALRGKEGLGSGDASLLGLLGFVFGWQSLLGLVFLSAGLGIVLGGGWLWLKKGSLTAQIPFGPFLGLAAVLYRLAPALWRSLFHF